MNKKPYVVNGEYVTRDDYNRIKFDSFLVRVPKGKKEKIKEHSENMQESINAFVNRAIEETMARDKEKTSG